MKNKKSLSKIKVLVFDEQRGSLQVHSGKELYADSIETDSGMYFLSDSKVYVDEWNGHTYYLFNVDIPAQVEASNLKKLRRSVALNNLFDYDVKKVFDLFGFLPYLVIILMIIFGGK